MAAGECGKKEHQDITRDKRKKSRKREGTTVTHQQNKQVVVEVKKLSYISNYFSFGNAHATQN